jgi:hypothetical protein
VVFDSVSDAFAHACLHQTYRLNPEEVIPALVLERGTRGEEGELYFLLRLTDRSGGKEIWAQLLRGAQQEPVPGDLVGFRVVRIASEIPEPANIIGYIAFGFAPVYVEGKGWRIAANYTPANLKPEIRF